jgi:hypothetical protein
MAQYNINFALVNPASGPAVPDHVCTNIEIDDMVVWCRNVMFNGGYLHEEANHFIPAHRIHYIHFTEL